MYRLKSLLVYSRNIWIFQLSCHVHSFDLVAISQAHADALPFSLALAVNRFPTCSDPMSLSVRTHFVSSSYYSHLKCVYTSTENVQQSDWKHSNAEYCEWVGKPSIGYQNLMNCVPCFNYFHCTVFKAPMKFHTIRKFCKCRINHQNQCKLVVKLTMENTDRLPLLRLFPLQRTVRIEDTMFVHRLKAS